MIPPLLLVEAGENVLRVLTRPAQTDGVAEGAVVREKTESRQREEGSTKDGNGVERERKRVMTKNIPHQSIGRQSRLLTLRNTRMMIEDVKGEGVAQTIVTIKEIDVGDRVHGAHKEDHPTIADVTPGPSQDQGLIREGRRNGKESGLVIKTVPAERAAAARALTQSRRDLIAIMKGAVLLNGQTGTMFLALPR